LFPFVIFVFSLFFFIAQFKLSDRYKGVKIASWSFPLAAFGAISFLFGFQKFGITLFVIGIPFILIGWGFHIYIVFHKK
ncbi:MAG: hypothetical protein P4L87_02165, partial [Formivibrio sp.]|nr:hypothetical protein [Formivibrio sp.]